MTQEVNVAVLTRDESPLDPKVVEAIRQQVGVRVFLHRVVGRRWPTDQYRWETIARARNQAIVFGTCRWFMFVDDDIVIARDCVLRLIDFLTVDSRFAAAGARSLRNERPEHVGMGATLFRRQSLGLFEFRWEENQCECQCCCDDLRQQGHGITYVPGAKAVHLRDDGYAADALDETKVNLSQQSIDSLSVAGRGINFGSFVRLPIKQTIV